MKAPQLPANEAERLASLRSYEVLDTDQEESFDGLARLAAHILETPIALISLVDTNRQWFKARYGLDVPELPRDVSFCGHAVEHEAPLIVPDTHKDDRFADNPLVTGDPRIRFYAGMPLRSPDGYVLGTVCAIDRVPREATPRQLEMLALLGAQVVRLLEKRRLRLTIDRQRREAVAAAEQLRLLFSMMGEGVVVQDASGAIVDHNEAACQILGLSPDELAGRKSVDPQWRSVHEDGTPFPGEDHPAMRVLQTGERQANVIMGVHTPDGVLRWISINSIPSGFSGDRITEVITTFHDITILKQAAERLNQQERLATTGTLLAGVAHEINNPLAFVIGNLDLAFEELRAVLGPSPSSRMQELLDAVREARVGAGRIRTIVRGLRALSREDVALGPVELREVVESSINMALHEIRPKARVTVDLDGTPAVLGDESRLTQVIMNLLVNAAQAFESGNPDSNSIVIRARLSAPATVRLSVIDNGPGVPQSMSRSIFDPFFTTKPVGVGTGLGLSVSRQIISSLGGSLSLDPSSTQGAAFHIDLRVASDEDRNIFETPVEATQPRGRIVVIDDDIGVLTTMRRLLSRQHDVTTFNDPREACDAIDSLANVDVIFCDLMMPHLTGQDVFARITATRPELAPLIVFVTGGATSAAARAFLGALPNEVVEKPFAMSDLLAIARRYVMRRSGA